MPLQGQSKGRDGAQCAGFVPHFLKCYRKCKILTSEWAGPTGARKGQNRGGRRAQDRSKGRGKGRAEVGAGRGRSTVEQGRGKTGTRQRQETGQDRRRTGITVRQE